MPTRRIHRRSLLARTAAAAAVSATAAFAQPAAKPKPVRLGVVGVGGRGTGLLRTLLGMKGTEVPAVCDTKPASATTHQPRPTTPLEERLESQQPVSKKAGQLHSDECLRNWDAAHQPRTRLPFPSHTNGRQRRDHPLRSTSLDVRMVKFTPEPFLTVG